MIPTKGWFGRCFLDPQNRDEYTKNGTMVPKTGTIEGTKGNDGTENRNEGTKKSHFPSAWNCSCQMPEFREREKSLGHSG